MIESVDSDAEEIRIAIYRRMSVAQKFAQAQQLRDTAWAVKAAGLRMQYPDWPEEQIQKKVRDIFLYATT